MPLYEYKCPDCSKVFVLMEKTSSEGEVRTCPRCGGNSKKIISQTSFHLKGGGWYVTDYKGSSQKEKPTVCPAKESSSPACASCPASAPANLKNEGKTS